MERGKGEREPLLKGLSPRPLDSKIFLTFGRIGESCYQKSKIYLNDTIQHSIPSIKPFYICGTRRYTRKNKSSGILGINTYNFFGGGRRGG